MGLSEKSGRPFYIEICENRVSGENGVNKILAYYGMIWRRLYIKNT